ncbi:MAG: hypothetical protein COZ06_25495 [Armatimonadetes bacterium CG_4_10_14_3_um_filter_66_18]|nr:hypothetical protein [Armatimonadota bacterium]OIO92760.1 MAG: hypothetical protein AUJ96_31690 [Armatimonadetes bacterium CG2_30_66_41]PIU90732.1 MAG: hypothetical protein COS65_24280 [Armatimonadetes bacterium CG06_land_8_20_14_3_00_66_21]PIX42387.1 MAG: hypothetical protein COZ57_21350 [Armatimonadetes bacterium CG_4_8_14_3_um_filter_66_20]PIY42322.1 MAG: hypothetical protein COZ06_25495 [Armatimonadetes bacterium CG_4_10_14_3_um_filter_66_18]PIZ48511.1 MAG: hypothetical protein COY42_06
MNEDRYLQTLAERARLETPPPVDVADRVMAVLRESSSQRRFAPGPMAWVAALSAAAAIPMALAGYAAWQSLTSPLMVTLLSAAKEGLL